MDLFEKIKAESQPNIYFLSVQNTCTYLSKTKDELKNQARDEQQQRRRLKLSEQQNTNDRLLNSEIATFIGKVITDCFKLKSQNIIFQNSSYFGSFSFSKK